MEYPTITAIAGPTLPSKSRPFLVYVKHEGDAERVILQCDNPNHTYDIFEIRKPHDGEVEWDVIKQNSRSPHYIEADEQDYTDSDFADHILSYQIVGLIYELADPTGSTDIGYESAGEPSRTPMLQKVMASATWKMVGSHGSLEGLKETIKKNWSWSTVEFKETGTDTWDVYSGKGLVEGLRVVKKGKRYRFEMLES